MKERRSISHWISLSLLFKGVLLSLGCQDSSDRSFSMKEFRKEYVDHPPFQKVKKRLFEDYQGRLKLKKGCRVLLEKRRKGWDLAIHYNDDKEDEVLRTRFWDGDEGTFVDPDPELLREKKDVGKDPLEKVAADMKKGRPQLQNCFFQGKLSFYQGFPLYGYPGWYEDLIELLEGKSGLSDSLLYALGSAHQRFALDLISDKLLNYPVDERGFDLGSSEALSPEQLEEFRAKLHRAFALYDSIAARDPDFGTEVGRIGTKLGHARTRAFLALSAYSDPEEASKELSEGLYSDLIRSMAKNRLRSCDSNAILFTYGKLEALPLIYMQGQKGIRRDVSVIDINFNAEPRLTRFYLQGAFDAPPIPGKVTKTAIDEDRSAVLMVFKPAIPEDAMWLDQKIDTIVHGIEKSPKDCSVVKMRLTRSFRMEIEGDTIRGRTRGSFLTPKERWVLDGLAARQEGRPVHFSPRGSHDLNKRRLTDELRWVGTLQQFEPPLEEEGNVAFPETYRAFMNTYEWNGYQRAEAKGERRLKEIQGRILARMLQGIETEDKARKDSVRECFELVTDKVLEKGPVYEEASLPGLRDRSLLAKGLYDIGLMAKGDSVLVRSYRTLSRGEFQDPSRKNRVQKSLRRLAEQEEREKVLEEL